MHAPLSCAAGAGQEGEGGREGRRGWEVEEYMTETVFRARDNYLATQGSSHAKACSPSNPEGQPVRLLNTPVKSLSTFKPK